MASAGILEAIRRPEYTGDDRCLPCTAVNVVILGIVCLALGTIRRSLAVGVGVLGAGAIWLRGYVVPYTPRFAPRLVSVLPGDPFGHDDRELGGAGAGEPERGSLSGPEGDEDADGEAVLAALLDAGVLAEDREAVAPTEAFERRRDAEAEELCAMDDERFASAALAESAGTDADVVERNGRTYLTLAADSGRTIDDAWLRRPVAIAQTAAARALGGMGVDSDLRTDAAVAMGLFLTECPVCGESLEERPVGGCCGPPVVDAEGRPKTALTCPSCRVHLHVLE